MAEGDFTKSDGDILFASEANAQVGNFQTVEAGENITAGNVVYIHLTDGKAYVSDTGTADDIRASGIAVDTALSGADVIVQSGGSYKTTGLTDKADYYLGAAGALSTTLSGVRIGHALSTTALWIDIVQDDRDKIGTVKAYLADFTAIPANNVTAFWVECDGTVLSDAESILNGQTLPDLNGTTGSERILLGSTTSGTETQMSVSGTTGSTAASAGNGASGAHTHSFSANVTGGFTHTVRWLMKIK